MNKSIKQKTYKFSNIEIIIVLSENTLNLLFYKTKNYKDINFNKRDMEDRFNIGFTYVERWFEALYPTIGNELTIAFNDFLFVYKVKNKILKQFEKDGWKISEELYE